MTKSRLTNCKGWCYNNKNLGHSYGMPQVFVLAFAVSAAGLGRCAVPAEKLSNSHKLITLIQKLVDGLDSTVHAGTVQVVQ